MLWGTWGLGDLGTWGLGEVAMLAPNLSSELSCFASECNWNIKV